MILKTITTIITKSYDFNSVAGRWWLVKWLSEAGKMAIRNSQWRNVSTIFQSNLEVECVINELIYLRKEVRKQFFCICLVYGS